MTAALRYTLHVNDTPEGSPNDTNDRAQRASRPVPFCAAGELWRGAADGLIVSDDLNSRLEFEPPELGDWRKRNHRDPRDSLSATLPAAVPVLLPYQRQTPPHSLAATARSPWATRRSASPPPQPPPQLPPPKPPKPPKLPQPRRTLVDITNVEVLVTEVRALETENALLRKHVALQDIVIGGMCNLNVFERENINAGPWRAAVLSPP